jgi:gamma-glutamyltranspeptidase/glutathione hydrolase
MVTSPHHLASQAGLAVLREGGNAIEAAVATAATLSVVTPHMCGLGGDAFWLIGEPGKPPVSIDGSGCAAARAEPALYRGLAAVPQTGPLAAATVAGAVSSWQLALDVSAQWGGRLPLTRLFEDALEAARGGFAVTGHQATLTGRGLAALKGQPGFAETFLLRKKAPAAGTLQRLPALADTLERLAAAGLDDFYRGEIGRSLAAGLQAAGSPLRAEDLARHRGMRRRPLSLGLAAGTLYNTAPPTQGLASLVLLGLFQRLGVRESGGSAHVHALAEATKLALRLRDTHIADPARMSVHATTYLSEHVLDRMAADIRMDKAAPWPQAGAEGDTVWLGVMDGAGRAVSVIQSLMHPFGSGVTVEGVAWHNRATGFSLDPERRNHMEPRRRPLHTLSPALARLKDGRTLVWGSMGGDAQPQVQAQIFTRHVVFGEPLQAAVSAPRWRLGAHGLDLEARFDPEVVEDLRRAGHLVQLVGSYDSLMGHAGALCRHPDGRLEGAADPRSDGCVAGY